MSRPLVPLALFALAILGIGSAPSADLILESGRERGSRRRIVASSPDATLSPTEAVLRAEVDGKYRNLLAVISVPQDRDTYTEFSDYGFSNTPAWGGYSGLPPAYWVYVAPHWYLWKDQGAVSPVAAVTSGRRSWGPEQATGEPDTDGPGDLVTAWASRTQDEQDEWLELEYDQAFKPTGVIVHETLSPGALTRITMFQSNSEEADAWRGSDPTPWTAEHGVSLIPVSVAFETKKIRIYLASKDVPGWNELDAVGLIDSRGKTHWAIHATASSTYAEPASPPERLKVLGDAPRSR